MNRLILNQDLQALEPVIRRVVEETVLRLESGRVGRDDGTARDGRGVAPAAPLLRPRDAARFLAVSERTLWELTRRGDVPHVRIGRAVRYDQHDLRAWAAAKKRRAAEKDPGEDRPADAGQERQGG